MEIVFSIAVVLDGRGSCGRGDPARDNNYGEFFMRQTIDNARWFLCFRAVDADRWALIGLGLRKWVAEVRGPSRDPVDSGRVSRPDQIFSTIIFQDNTTVTNYYRTTKGCNPYSIFRLIFSRNDHWWRQWLGDFKRFETEHR